jgi:hypothetical protein
VRGHVLRVRDRGRNLGVAPGGVERERGQRRCVVRVDHVVRDARMIRVFAEERQQDGIGPVRRRKG